jgi:hypothetical protein
MDQHREDRQMGWPSLAWLSIIVVAFMLLSLSVTATGTARFALVMGYEANVGYAVGALFDLAKGPLFVGVLVFWARRSLGLWRSSARSGFAS